MLIAYKFRLYPTAAQAETLRAELREAADLYNCALQHRRDAYRSHGVSVSIYDQRQELAAMRKDGCLKMVTGYDSADQVLIRLDNSFKAFFLRLKAGQKPGFPRFRSASRYNTLVLRRYAAILLPEEKKARYRKLRIKGIGHVKIRLHRQYEGAVKTVSIKREGTRWFAIFSCDREPKLLSSPSGEVGIDVGLKTLCTLSDGTEFENIRPFESDKRKLRIEQRKLSRRRPKPGKESVSEVSKAKDRSGQDLLENWPPSIEPRSQREPPDCESASAHRCRGFEYQGAGIWDAGQASE